jgi:hypothetical protein
VSQVLPAADWPERSDQRAVLGSSLASEYIELFRRMVLNGPEGKRSRLAPEFVREFVVRFFGRAANWRTPFTGEWQDSKKQAYSIADSSTLSLALSALLERGGQTVGENVDTVLLYEDARELFSGIDQVIAVHALQCASSVSFYVLVNMPTCDVEVIDQVYDVDFQLRTKYPEIDIDLKLVPCPLADKSHVVPENATAILQR